MAMDPLTAKMQKLIRRNGNFCLKCQVPTKAVRDGVFRCPQCGEEYLSDFGRVRKYLEEMGPSTARQISVATGVSPDAVAMLLEGNQIELSEESPVFLECEICGVPLKSGKICFNCSAGIDPSTTDKHKRELLDNVGDIPTSVQGTGKIYYMGNRRKGSVSMATFSQNDESRLVIDLKNKKNSQA